MKIKTGSRFYWKKHNFKIAKLVGEYVVIDQMSKRDGHWIGAYQVPKKWFKKNKKEIEWV